MVSSPWGPLTVRDAHVHFFSHKFFTLLAAQKPGLHAEDLPGILGWDLPSSEDPAALADHWFEELDRYLVDTTSTCRLFRRIVRSFAGFWAIRRDAWKRAWRTLTNSGRPLAAHTQQQHSRMKTTDLKTA